MALRTESYAAHIRGIYAEAETEILRRLAAAIAEGLDEQDWAARKAAEIVRFRRIVLRETARFDKVPGDVLSAVEAAAGEAVERAVKILERRNLLRPGYTPRVMSGSRLAAIAGEATEALATARFQILRAADDVYREVISRVVTVDAALGGDRVAAAQRALNEFADRGIGRFVDSAGRRWELESYAEMATRSAMMRAAAEGHTQTLAQSGLDLVIVSGGSESCPVCTPWEGKILSISGTNDRYPSVAEAQAAGLLHPNCTHTLDPWIPGVSEGPRLDDRGEVERRYEERQKQRYLERQLRKWRRREAAAITDDQRKFAAARRREWQARLNDFIDETGRKHWREREVIGRAR